MDLAKAAEDLGFSSFGVCEAVPSPHLPFFDAWLGRGHHASMDWLRSSRDLRAHVDTLLPGARSVVAVTLDYNQPNPVRQGFPRIAKYALSRDYHRILRSKLKKLASMVESEGYACRPCVDSAPVFERDYARLAGLGWFGKNTLLIDSRRGSFFFIGLLLTTMPLNPDEPAEGGCGTCTKCIDACPTGAIVFQEDRWSIDSRRCVSYLTIEHDGPIPEDLARGMGDWTFGCDVCQDVCPFNRERPSQPMRGARATEPDLLKIREWPSLKAVETLTEDEWDLLTRGSPFRRAGLEGFRRNARINLENEG